MSDGNEAELAGTTLVTVTDPATHVDCLLEADPGLLEVVDQIRFTFSKSNECDLVLKYTDIPFDQKVRIYLKCEAGHEHGYTIEFADKEIITACTTNVTTIIEEKGFVDIELTHSIITISKGAAEKLIVNFDPGSGWEPGVIKKTIPFTPITPISTTALKDKVRFVGKKGKVPTGKSDINLTYELESGADEYEPFKLSINTKGDINPLPVTKIPDQPSSN